MRSINDIYADILSESSRLNAAKLRQLADEAIAADAPTSQALAFFANGIVSRVEGRYDEAIQNFMRAYDGFKQVGDVDAAITSLIRLGQVHQRKGDNRQALATLRQALSEIHTSTSPIVRSRTHKALSVLYGDVGDHPQSLLHAQQSLLASTEANDDLGIASAHVSIGLIYERTDNYSEALQSYLKALDLFTQIGNKPNTASTLSNIGVVYGRVDDLDKSISYFTRARDMAREIRDLEGEALYLGNIAAALQQRNDHEAALEILQESLTLTKSVNDVVGISYVTSAMIDSLLGLGRLEEAERLLDERESMYLDEPALRAGQYAFRAEICKERKDLESAQRHLERALEITEASGLRGKSALVHEQLAELAELRQDLPGYIKHFKEQQRILGEIRGLETSQRLAMIEAERKMAAERQEHEKHLAVLHSTLPKHIADRVVRGEQVNDHFDHAAVMFADIVGFTTLSANIPAEKVVAFLEQLFSSFDDICERHGITKVKTIGDSYMAVAFPEESSNREHAPSSAEERMAAAALEMLQAVTQFAFPTSQDVPPQSLASPGAAPVQIRLGIHSGPVTAGVIGTQRLQYDVWGDTVNVASRLESTGEPDRVHVSSAFALRLDSGSTSAPYHLRQRGDTELKGKGIMTTYWLQRRG